MRVEPISGVSGLVPVIPLLPVRKSKKTEKTRRASGAAFVASLRQTIEEEIRMEYEQKYQALLAATPQAQAERLAAQTRTFQEQYSRVQMLRQCRAYYE